MLVSTLRNILNAKKDKNNIVRCHDYYEDVLTIKRVTFLRFRKKNTDKLYVP